MYVCACACACAWFICVDVIRAAQQVPINDLTVLIKRRDKTPFWRRFYASLPQGELAPSTMDVMQLPKRDLLMPVEIPKPAGRPVKRRIPNFLERNAGAGGGGSPNPRLSPGGSMGVRAGGIQKKVRVIKCKKCGAIGHYQKTCKAGSGQVLH